MIYLASASPRRKELLHQLDIAFEQLIVDVDESALDNENPHQYVIRVAQLKAQTAAKRAANAWPVLAADTIVVINNRILGKPKDRASGYEMLRALSNATHEVKTAISMIQNERHITEVVTTKVTFRELSDSEISDYWACGEPADKAGGYGIQGIAGKFVKHISGSYSAVVGLPLMETEQLIMQFDGKA